MSTAKELRQTALQSVEVIVSNLLEHLLSEIDKAAKAGYTVYRTTNEEFHKDLVRILIVKKLIALGFRISFELGSLSSGDVLTIKW